jgi:dTDP-4-dehydrorhamnose reductase
MPSHKDLDITDTDALARFFSETTPDVVINTVALIQVDAIEDDPVPAWQINAIGAGNVARALAQTSIPNTRLVHISTNYVFGDTKDRYVEDDPVAPINSYGKSKAVGEELVQHYSERAGLPYHIVRTSWIFSSQKKTFVDSVAQALLKGETIQAFTDQYGNLTYGPDLARAIVDDFVLMDRESGIYHLVNDVKNARRAVSRYEIAIAIAGMLGIANSQVGTTPDPGFFKAYRPSKAVILNTKLPPLPDWEESLRSYITAQYVQRTSA